MIMESKFHDSKSRSHQRQARIDQRFVRPKKLRRRHIQQSVTCCLCTFQGTGRGNKVWSRLCSKLSSKKSDPSRCCCLCLWCSLSFGLCLCTHNCFSCGWRSDESLATVSRCARLNDNEVAIFDVQLVFPNWVCLLNLKLAICFTGSLCPCLRRHVQLIGPVQATWEGKLSLTVRGLIVHSVIVVVLSYSQRLCCEVICNQSIEQVVTI